MGILGRTALFGFKDLAIFAGAKKVQNDPEIYLTFKQLQAPHDLTDFPPSEDLVDKDVEPIKLVLDVAAAELMYETLGGILDRIKYSRAKNGLPPA